MINKDRLFDNWNKINTREELIEMLKSYKGILTHSMINYLNSLIDLEFSVIRDYIGIDDRNALSELEVYKRIAMYNIYNRALNMFKQNNSEFIISGNDNGWEGLSISSSLGERRIELFDFVYERTTGYNSKIPEGYKNMRIGEISLFQTLESKELREEELTRIMNILERLYNKKNPYLYRYGGYGRSSSNWAIKHSYEIQKYEKLFEKLDSKKELNDEDKREIEITKQFHDLLLEDYGLNNKSFEEQNNQYFLNSKEYKTKLQKTLVKKMPNINIKNNIKYI